MSTHKHRKTIVALVEKYWSDWSMSEGGKHPKLELRLGRHRRVMPVPLTPSDHRSLSNWEKHLRHKIQELKDAACA